MYEHPEFSYRAAVVEMQRHERDLERRRFIREHADQIVQVLELLSAGLSNREIGTRLFISAKTVSVHVSAILRKLGVTSRTEAAVVATKRSGGGA